MAPDLVVVDEEENRREDYDALVAAGAAVHALAIRSVADVAPALTRLASVLAVDVRLPARPSPPRMGGGAAPRALVPLRRTPRRTNHRDTHRPSAPGAAGAVA